MKEILTEIDICASRYKVWQILTDFEKYAEWNPFIRRIEGSPVEGAKIRILVTTPSGVERKYSPKVTRYINEREMRWVGKIPGLFSGEHIFVIENVRDDKVHLVHREVFGGLLATFFRERLDADVRMGFEEMNMALKKRSEG